MSDCFYMNMSVYVRNGQSKTLIIRERMYLVIRVHCVSAWMNGITEFSHTSDSLLDFSTKYTSRWDVVDHPAPANNHL